MQTELFAPPLMVREMAPDERPAARLAEHGAGSLSDSELLTAMLDLPSVEHGRRLLNHFGGHRRMASALDGELASLPAMGPGKVARFRAITEFHRRLSREQVRDREISTPEDVYKLVGAEMAPLPQESVRVILLNRRRKLITVEELFRGTGGESFANPPEILRSAISRAADSIILVHNHPAGDPSPSQADHRITRRLCSACDAVGIIFTDHVVIGQPGSLHEPYFSFREAGLL